MRAIATAFLCSGCLISAPEGKPQDWPPTLSGTVQAVVAGDLDANGSTDIVVFASGGAGEAGMYLLENSADLELGASSPVKSFSRFVPTTWKTPVAATLVASAAPRVYVAHSESVIHIDLLSNTLETLDSGATSIAATTTLWTTPLSFPGGMVHAAASNGSNIDHLETSFDAVKPVPPPMMQANWDGAQAATTYTSASDTMVVVATSKQVQRAIVPTVMGAPWNYVVVRDGAPWVGQVVTDLDGDGSPEILGFDPMKHDVCVVDPTAATIPVTPSCVHLSTTFPGMDVMLLTGQNLTMTSTPDILVAQASATQTDYTMMEDITFTKATGALTAVITREGMKMGPGKAITVLANGGQGTPFVALAFGTDGKAVCVVGPC